MIYVQATEKEKSKLFAQGNLIYFNIDVKDTFNGFSMRKDTLRLMVAPMSGADHKQAQYLKAIVISNSEPIQGDDKYCFHKKKRELLKITHGIGEKSGEVHHEHGWSKASDVAKVLVLPEQINPDVYQSLADRNMFYNCSVQVECEKISKSIMARKYKILVPNHQVKLNRKKYANIQLIKAEDFQSDWDPIRIAYMKIPLKKRPDFYEWLRKNYDAPTKR